jgi:hypothetical protein
MSNKKVTELPGKLPDDKLGLTPACFTGVRRGSREEVTESRREPLRIPSRGAAKESTHRAALGNRRAREFQPPFGAAEGRVRASLVESGATISGPLPRRSRQNGPRAIGMRRGIFGTAYAPSVQAVMPRCAADCRTIRLRAGEVPPLCVLAAHTAPRPMEHVPSTGIAEKVDGSLVEQLGCQQGFLRQKYFRRASSSEIDDVLAPSLSGVPRSKRKAPAYPREAKPLSRQAPVLLRRFPGLTRKSAVLLGQTFGIVEEASVLPELVSEASATGHRRFPSWSRALLHEALKLPTQVLRILGESRGC